MDGRLVALEKIVDAKGSQKNHVEIASILAGLFGHQQTTCAFETFHGDVAGKNGFPAVDYAEVDGTIAKAKSSEWNATSYLYKKPAEKECTIYVNPRYHANIVTAKSYEAATEESREFFFPVVKETLTAENDVIAKGVKLITKDF